MSIPDHDAPEIVGTIAIQTAIEFLSDYRQTGEVEDLEAAKKIIQRVEKRAKKVFSLMPKPGMIVPIVVPMIPPEDDE